MTDLNDSGLAEESRVEGVDRAVRAIERRRAGSAGGADSCVDRWVEVASS